MEPFSCFKNKIESHWERSNEWTLSNVTPGRVRASLPSEFIEKSFQYVCMHTIFDTRVELFPVVELYLWYWQVLTQFWTVLIKFPVWKTFFTEPIATCSCIHRVGQGPRFPFCSVNGAALLRFVFPQIPWTFAFLFSKIEKEAFASNSRAQVCTGTFVVTKLWYGMCGAVSTWSVSLLLLKFILHVALYLPVITFLHHHSFLFLVVFNSNLNTIAPFLYVCCILNAVCIDRPDYDGLLVEIDTVDKKRKSKTIVELS